MSCDYVLCTSRTIKKCKKNLRFIGTLNDVEPFLTKFSHFGLCHYFKDATVDDFLRKLSELNGIPVPEQRIIFSGKQLECGKRLSDYHIEHGSTVFLVLRLRGGMSSDLSPPPKELDEDVELSEAPDMITWDDDPDNKRAKMPCGHAISE